MYDEKIDIEVFARFVEKATDVDIRNLISRIESIDDPDADEFLQLLRTLI